MPDPQVATPIALMADCTIRGIGQVRAALLEAPSSGPEVTVTCDDVAQADLTLVQVLVSAHASFAARGQNLVLTGVPDHVRSLLERASVSLPDCAGIQG